MSDPKKFIKKQVLYFSILYLVVAGGLAILKAVTGIGLPFVLVAILAYVLCVIFREKSITGGKDVLSDKFALRRLAFGFVVSATVIEAIIMAVNVFYGSGFAQFLLSFLPVGWSILALSFVFGCVGSINYALTGFIISIKAGSKRKVMEEVSS